MRGSVKTLPEAFWADGAGNRFVLLQGLQDVPADVMTAVQILCSAAHPVGPKGLVPDGIVLITPPKGEGDVRMVVFNADGSRPQACGNALRCVARRLFDQHPEHVGPFVVETDAGLRRVWPEGPLGARVSMGMARRKATLTQVIVAGRALEGQEVNMGNPHFVLRASAEDLAQLESIGRTINAHPSFPEGANVEFVLGAEFPVPVRVWERGVGETMACGSGACAVAEVVMGPDWVSGSCAIAMPGGELWISKVDGELCLQGAAQVSPWMGPFPVQGWLLATTSQL